MTKTTSTTRTDSHPGIDSGKPLLLDNNLRIIFGITIMAVVGTFSVSPALPRLVSELGISEARIGLVMTVFTVPGIFIMPLIGICADMFGRRTVVGICLLLFTAAGSACLFAGGFYSLLLLRFFQGIGAAPLSSLNIAFISDFFSGRRRSAAMGYNQAVLSVAAAILTALGGVLAALGWRYPFVLPLLGLPIGLQVLLRWKNSEPAELPRWPEYRRQILQTLRRPDLAWQYVLTVLGLMVVWGSYFIYFPILMGIRLNQPTPVIGLVMTVMMICSALSSAMMGKLSSFFSGRQLYRMCFFLYAVSLAAIPFISQVWLLPLPVAGIGLAQGIFIPNLQNHLGSLSSIHNRGIVMALYGSAIRTGQTLGPISAGLLFAWVGMDGIFFISAGLALLLAVTASAFSARHAAQ